MRGEVAMEDIQLSDDTRASLAAVYVGERDPALGRGLNRDLTALPPDAREPNPEHKRVIALRCAGYSLEEVQDITGYTQVTISKIYNDPDYEWYKTMLGDQMAFTALSDARQVIQAHTKEAAMQLVRLMRGAESENVRKQAADSILDRGGVPKSEVQQRTSLVLEGDEASSILQALRDMKMEIPPMLEVQETHALITTATRQSESHSDAAGQPTQSGSDRVKSGGPEETS